MPTAPACTFQYNFSHADRFRRCRHLAVLVALFIAAGFTAAPASAEPVVTITFVRHAESEANARSVIDTSVPGPPITPKGEQQAKEAAVVLSRTPHDGIYPSTLIRTQQTAQPLADELGEQITDLPGLREIEAGDFEGRSDPAAVFGYLPPLRQWVAGDRLARIPGSIGGNEFDARFEESVDAIYRSGQRQPVAFSHGAAISMWTMMNVRNPRPELVESQPLPNTGRVVVEGSPTDGWTLLDWNGTKID